MAKLQSSLVEIPRTYPQALIHLWYLIMPRLVSLMLNSFLYNSLTHLPIKWVKIAFEYFKVQKDSWIIVENFCWEKMSIANRWPFCFHWLVSRRQWEDRYHPHFNKYRIYSKKSPVRLLNFRTLRVGAYSRRDLFKFPPFSASSKVVMQQNNR